MRSDPRTTAQCGFLSSRRLFGLLLGRVGIKANYGNDCAEKEEKRTRCQEDTKRKPNSLERATSIPAITVKPYFGQEPGSNIYDSCHRQNRCNQVATSQSD